MYWVWMPRCDIAGRCRGKQVMNHADICAAAQRIAPFVHRTPVFHSKQIDRMLGCEIYFKAENLQKVGAFKARGACNAILQLADTDRQKGVVTHSSGNHGAALAWAAAQQNIPCTVVMPNNAPQVKKDAVAGYGATIHFCEPTLAAREASVEKVISQTGATLVHPYDDERIVAGQGTAAQEMLAQLDTAPDGVMVPTGGGGLLAGTAIAVKGTSRNIKVYGAEPAGANDAWQGFNSGQWVAQNNPQTVADGLRTSLGQRNFAIIKQQVDEMVLASEESIIEAMRLIWTRLKIVVESSSAVPLAAIIDNPEQFAGKRIAMIISGGNVDLDNLPWR